MGDKPKLVLYYRKPRPTGNFSIEFLFDQLATGLQTDFNVVKTVSPYYSSGFFKRLYNAVVASVKQGSINHVVGDVHFLTIFLRKKKTVLTIHDCVFMNHPSGIARQIFKIFWLQLPVHRASIVTVVSQATKNEVLKYVKCDPGKIRVIPNFVSREFIPVSKAFNTECPVVLMIGTAPNKNIERCVQALKGIRSQLVIIGKLNAQQENMLEKTNLEVKNYKDLSLPEVVKLYQGSDVLLFASTSEGFGMPIIEAQKTGIPVITSDISPMREVAGEGACLVDPFNTDSIRNGLLNVLNDDQYRKKIIALGKANAIKYSYSSTLDQYKKIYEEILN